MNGFRRFWGVTFAVARRNFHNTVTNPALLIPSIAAPLVFFVVFAGGLSGVGKAPGFNFRSGYTTFQFVFILIQASAFAGIFGGIGMGRDFESGFMRRLMLAAPTRRGIVAGYALASLGRVLLVYTVLMVVGVLTGVHLDGSFLQVALLLVLTASFSLVSGFWAMGIALRLRTPQAAPLMMMPVFISMFMAPVFVPLALLTGWVEAVAKVNPVTRFLQAGRGLISGRPDGTALAFGASAGLIALFVLWTLTGLRRAERSA